MGKSTAWARLYKTVGLSYLCEWESALRLSNDDFVIFLYQYMVIESVCPGVLETDCFSLTSPLAFFMHFLFFPVRPLGLVVYFFGFYRDQIHVKKKTKVKTKESLFLLYVQKQCVFCYFKHLFAQIVSQAS